MHMIYEQREKIKDFVVRYGTRFERQNFYGKLWDYDAEGWAGKFFENRKKSLKRQLLKPYEDFRELIERHCGL